MKNLPTCAHCGSADLQALVHEYQCFTCGERTRIADGTPVMPDPIMLGEPEEVSVAADG